MSRKEGVKFVGIGEMIVTESPEHILVAPNLGSCIGMAVFDPVNRRGGLIHCLLPLSKSDPEKAKARPCMFVDSGVVKLLDAILQNGANKKDLQIYIVGGAQINDPNNVFEIGKKNITILRKILWKNSLLIQGQDLGGDYSRTLSLEMATGEVWLKTKGEQVRLS